MRKLLFAWIILLLFLILNGLHAEEENCSDPRYRELDFWVGEWTVTDANGKQVGTSKIEKVLNGCVILEKWTGTDGFNGMSFNHYNRALNRWQQTWVDSRGQQLDFAGVYKEGAMRYEGRFTRNDGKSTLTRMTFFNLGKDGVRQLWEQSADNAKTWRVDFDGRYARVK